MPTDETTTEAPEPTVPVNELAEILLTLEVDLVESDLKKPPTEASDKTKRKYLLELHHTLEKTFKDTVNVDETPSMEYAKALPAFVTQCSAIHAEGRIAQVEDIAAAKDLYLLLSKDSVILQKQEEGEWPTPMSQEDLKTFVMDCVGNLTFSHLQLPNAEMVNQVFMVVGLGGLDSRALYEILNIGLIYEYLSKAGPMAINGYPMFFSARFMNKADWARCLAAIRRHIEATTNLEV